MIYTILPNTTTKLNETSGTIQNISQSNKIEISNSADFSHNIILYPYETRAFNIQLYARLFDNNDLPLKFELYRLLLAAELLQEVQQKLKLLPMMNLMNCLMKFLALILP